MTPALSPRTVIEAFLPFEGRVGLGVVLDAAEAVAVPAAAIRVALGRMVQAGEIERSGRGRAGTAELTPAGRRRLQRDRTALGLAFAQDDGRAPWDGRWRLIAVSATEANRSVRDALRRRLLDLGAARVSTGLYLSPHDLADHLVLPNDTSGRDRLVLATAETIEVRGTSDAATLTEMLWPRAPIVAAYDALDAALDAAATQTGPTARLLLADALEHAMRDDPLVPPELRGADWAPTRQRTRWRQAWAALPADQVYAGWLPSA